MKKQIQPLRHYYGELSQIRKFLKTQFDGKFSLELRPKSLAGVAFIAICLENIDRKKPLSITGYWYKPGIIKLNYFFNVPKGKKK